MPPFPSYIKKIGILRALQLGDMLVTVPALRALRSAYPDAEITLIGLPWAKSFVSRFNHYLDRFITFPGYPGLPEQVFCPNAFVDFLHEVLKENFDLVLQMQGNGNLVNPMIELWGAKHYAGFFKPGIHRPDKGLFTEYPEHLHEIERHLKLMEFLGIPSAGTDLEFPLTKPDFEEFSTLKLHFRKGEYVCIHPGSRNMDRRWPAEYFARLADLVSREGFIPVLTGTQDELELVAEVTEGMESVPLVLAGRTSMGAVSVLIKEAAGLISNCTGVAHIAAALKVPSVVISLNGEAFRWDPLDKRLHRSIDWLATPDFNLALEATKDLLAYTTKEIQPGTAN